MSTSGSRNFTVSRSEIIEEAVANIGVLDPGNTVSAEESARASKRLNLMIKGWMARGANLWRREELTLFLQPNQRSYTFGTDDIAQSSRVIETTLTSGVALSGTTATVASATGISTGYVVGFHLDAGGLFFPSGGVTVAGSTLTFSASSGQASAGNAVYAYPNTGAAGGKNTTLNPLKIAYAYRRDSQGTDTTVRLIGREEYAALSRKGSSGPVTELCHDRQTTSRILVWPVIDRGHDQLILIADRVVEDFDTVADTPDFPTEWLNALMWGLSAELANTYGLPISERQWLKNNALVEFEAANTFDIEDSTVRLEFMANGG